jgi:1,2-diacylglycerol 3-beta-galactosyltransferase
MQKIEIIYFNAGGGHKAAAMALKGIIQEKYTDWSVILTDLSEVADSGNLFERITGSKPEDVYNKILASGFTYGLSQHLKMLQAGIKIIHPMLMDKLKNHWSVTNPDMVVSLIPNFNRALGLSLTETLPDIPFVTILTDMADYPPHFWIEPEVDQNLICGTEKAVQQAIEAGVDINKIYPVSGMILRSSFYNRPPVDKVAERVKLGLPATEPVGLVLFGGLGSKSMIGINKRLPNIPLILMCGKNKKLAATLRKQKSTSPRIVVEFTDDVAKWMALADFFVGKPGPGSITEAIHMGLPVIVTKNAKTIPQERWNTDWVREKNVGVVCKTFRTIKDATNEMILRLPEFQANAAKINNTAIFEIPKILKSLLAP